MVWTIDFTKSADKQFDQLDKTIQIRIVKFLNTRLAKMDDPRQLGNPLQGTLSDYWSYRVGDYRIPDAYEYAALKATHKTGLRSGTFAARS